jgi:hypothetical protein
MNETELHLYKSCQALGPVATLRVVAEYLFREIKDIELAIAALRDVNDVRRLVESRLQPIDPANPLKL